MVNLKKSGNYIFNATVAVPKKLPMDKAIEFLDKEVNVARHAMLEELADKKGVKLQFSN